MRRTILWAGGARVFSVGVAVILALMLWIAATALSAPMLSGASSAQETPTSEAASLQPFNPTAIPEQATSVRSSSGGSPPQLSLPWEAGQSWKLTGGLHSWANVARNPQSSLDFGSRDDRGQIGVIGDGVVHAAGGGTVHLECDGTPNAQEGKNDNFVRIDHGDGWHTSYYHLKNIRVSEGQKVPVGEPLGEISDQIGCGGVATAPHLHFTLWHFKGKFHASPNQEYPLQGVSIGGYTVQQGGASGADCFTRDYGDPRLSKICVGDRFSTHVEPIWVWTRDGNGNDKTSFAPGDAIQYTVVVNNPASTTPKARLDLGAARMPDGPYIFGPASFWVDVHPGLQGYYTDGTTIPANAPTGEYAFTMYAGSRVYPNRWVLDPGPGASVFTVK